MYPKASVVLTRLQTAQNTGDECWWKNIMQFNFNNRRSGLHDTQYCNINYIDENNITSPLHIRCFNERYVSFLKSIYNSGFSINIFKCNKDTEEESIYYQLAAVINEIFTEEASKLQFCTKKVKCPGVKIPVTNPKIIPLVNSNITKIKVRFNEQFSMYKEGSKIDANEENVNTFMPSNTLIDMLVDMGSICFSSQGISIVPVANIVKVVKCLPTQFRKYTIDDLGSDDDEDQLDK